MSNIPISNPHLSGVRSHGHSKTILNIVAGLGELSEIVPFYAELNVLKWPVIMLTNVGVGGLPLYFQGISLNLWLD